LNSQVWEEPRHVNNQRAMGATVENFDMLEYHNRLVDIKNDVLRAWHLAALGQEPSYGDYYSVG
jgi:hypothetical protein